MVPGDRLVYYASGWRKVFALMEVVGEPTDDSGVAVAAWSATTVAGAPFSDRPVGATWAWPRPSLPMMMALNTLNALAVPPPPDQAAVRVASCSGPTFGLA